jgi:hypothetical protein
MSQSVPWFTTCDTNHSTVTCFIVLYIVLDLCRGMAENGRGAEVMEVKIKIKIKVKVKIKLSLCLFNLSTTP